MIISGTACVNPASKRERACLAGYEEKLKMKYRFISALLITLVLVGCGRAALSKELPCAPHEELAKGMFDAYTQSLIWSGVTQNGYDLRLYQDAATGRWTVSLDRLIGEDLECIYSTGTNGHTPRAEAE